MISFLNDLYLHISVLLAFLKLLGDTGSDSHCLCKLWEHLGYVSGDEIHSLGDTVNDYHDHFIAMLLRKLHNKGNTDDVPSICGGLCRVELSIRSMVLQLSPVA
jgi:hypothetical protein